MRYVGNHGPANRFPDETPVAGCVYEDLYSFGSRSFTIWDTSTGRPVFDSGSDFERITAQQLGGSFNASNDSNDGDDRSDDKGPEPEAVEIASINGNTFAFIALERVGGVMVYNITNPQNAEFVHTLILETSRWTMMRSKQTWLAPLVLKTSSSSLKMAICIFGVKRGIWHAVNLQRFTAVKFNEGDGRV